jgi:hypothetical protein
MVWGVMRMARLSALEDGMHAAVFATGEPAAAGVAETVSGDLDNHGGDSDDTAGEKRAEADLNEIDICGDVCTHEVGDVDATSESFSQKGRLVLCWAVSRLPPAVRYSWPGKWHFCELQGFLLNQKLFWSKSKVGEEK